MKVPPSPRFYPNFYPNVNSYGLSCKLWSFIRKKLLIIRTQLGLKYFYRKNKMLLQCSYSCKFPASSIFSSVGPGGPRRGQELLPLKVAPIQPSVTAAFHLQSRRDSDCQMWELICHLKYHKQIHLAHCNMLDPLGATRFVNLICVCVNLCSCMCSPYMHLPETFRAQSKLSCKVQ